MRRTALRLNSTLNGKSQTLGLPSLLWASPSLAISPINPSSSRKLPLLTVSLNSSISPTLILSMYQWSWVLSSNDLTNHYPSPPILPPGLLGLHTVNWLGALTTLPLPHILISLTLLDA